MTFWPVPQQPMQQPSGDFDFQLPRPQSRLAFMGGPPEPLDIESAPEDSAPSYRVLSPDDVMPDNGSRWEQLIAAAQGPKRHLRPRQQRHLDSIPSIVTDESAMTRKQRLAYRDQQAITAGQPTRRERVMGELDDMFAGMAGGAAATTGIPAWQDAHASIQRSREMGAQMAATDRKSRLAALAQIGDNMADESKQRVALMKDPIAEYEGQVMPLSEVLDAENDRLRRQDFDTRESRLARAAAESSERAERRLAQMAADGATREELKREELRLRQETLNAIKGYRGASLGERGRHNREMEGIATRGLDIREQNPPNRSGGRTHATVRAADKLARERLLARREELQQGGGAPPPFDDSDVARLRATILDEWDADMEEDDDPLSGTSDEFERY